MYHFEKKTLKNLEIFERKKWAFLKKVTGKSNVPSSNNYLFIYFIIIIIIFGLERFRCLDFILFFEFFQNIYMTKVHQMLHGFLKFKET